MPYRLDYSDPSQLPVLFENADEMFAMLFQDLGSAGGGVSVSAGGASTSLSGFSFANSNGVSFGINGSVVTASVTTGAGAQLKISAGTLSSSVTAFTLSNSNNVSFGWDGSVITASVTTGFKISGGGSSSIVSGVAFLNANGVSWGYDGTNITASVAGGGLKISAGTLSSQVTAVTFSNSNGVSFGWDGSNLTASIATGTAAGLATASYWENYPFVVTSATTAIGISTIHLLMFNPQQAISGSWIRNFISATHVANTAGTVTSNSTWTQGRTYSFPYVIYTRGGGGSSASFVSIFSSLASLVEQFIFAATQSGAHTVTANFTVPKQGGTTTLSTSFSSLTSVYAIQTGPLTSLFAQNAIWMLDLPFNSTLAAGHYVIGLGYATASGTTGGTTNLIGASASFAFPIGSGPQLPLVPWGSTNSNSSGMAQPGNGSITSNVAFSTIASIPLSSITMRGNPWGNMTIQFVCQEYRF